MKIGVISADSTTESRVALTPDAVKKLRKLGFEVVVQSGAGLAAYYTDDSYQTAGADIASSSAEVVEQSQIITTISDLPAPPLKWSAPPPETIKSSPGPPTSACLNVGCCPAVARSLSP